MSAPYERDITAHSMLFSASGISQDGQHYDNQSRTSEAFVPKPFQFDQPELPSRNSSESGSPDIHFRPKLESKNSDSSDGSSSSEKRKSRVPVPDYIPRKQSLVRPEDYLPRYEGPTSKTTFNSYGAAPGWSGMSRSLDQDLASPENSPRSSRFGDAAEPPLFNSSYIDPASHRLSYDTLDSQQRTLGGKKLVKAADWKKKLKLNSHRSTQSMPSPNIHTVSFNSEKDFDEKFTSDIYLGAMPTPLVVPFDQPKSKGAKAQIGKFGPITAVLATIGSAVYFALRFYFLYKAEKDLDSHFVAGWLFLGVEFMYGTRTVMPILMDAFRHRLASTKLYRVKGDAFMPTIDVLILATGQHEQIVMDCAMAASRLDWPLDRIRVLVIDDTASSELQRRIESYATNRALHLTYHRRAKGNRKTDYVNHKASLINFGLTETRMQGRLAGEYTLVLEAETLPEVGILRALLPYMLQNSKLGLVRSKQGFYNIPKPSGHSFATFINSMEPVEDARSGFLMRRAGLDDIGGFPTGASVEDGQITALLQGKGYETHFVDEALTYGLIPDSFSVHLKQRLSRTLGPIRTARRLNGFLRGSRIKYMSLWQRGCAIYDAVDPLLSFDLFSGMITFPIALAWGGFLVPVMNIPQLHILIRALWVSTMLERLHELVFCYPTGNFTVRQLIQQGTFLAPYQMFNIIGAVLPFKRVSSPGWVAESSPKERDGRARRSFFSRLSAIMISFGSLLHVAVILAILVAVALSASATIKPLIVNSRSARQVCFILLLTVGWPSLHWIDIIIACWTPIAYVLFPPTVPARDYLLNREPITGVARPADEWKNSSPYKKTHASGLITSLLTTSYITALLVLTFTGTLDL